MLNYTTRGRPCIGSWILLAAAAIAVADNGWAQGPSPDSPAHRAAQEILAASRVQGGLIVHLGCGDGRLTAALRAEEKYTVHGLDHDPAKVQAAREFIAGLGLYGSVSVERWSGNRLPYADNLVNLVVAQDPGEISQDEMLRVLAPGGVVVTMAEAEDGPARKSSSSGSRGSSLPLVRKPRPAEIDAWTHFLHDAGNNAVARDGRVGPPRSLQWVAPPLWLRSHETPSGIQALVCSGERLFYFFDEGLIGITDQRLPERWSLVCRDAFNGKLLWKRPLQPWGWPEWARDKFEGQDWTTIRGGRTMLPDGNQRRLVADGDRLYATLGYRAPLNILEAATGKALATVQETQPVGEILASGGTVLVLSRDPSSPKSRLRATPGDEKPGTLRAIEGATGKVLWKKTVRPIPELGLAVDARRIVYLDDASLTCLGLDDGRELWQSGPTKRTVHTLIAHDGFVVLYAGSTIQTWDAATGKSLWQQEVPGSSGSERPDLFVSGGLVWRGMIPVDANLQAVAKSADAMALGLDLKTGEEKKRIVVRQLRSPEHHHRCYRNKATERYIISGMEGAEFMDLVGNDHCQNNWLRGACKLGVMPCNGLLYVPADQCFCQPGAKVLGFLAASADVPSRRRAVADADRLEKGPGYASSPNPRSPVPGPQDWPTFRHDPARHGSTPSAVPAQVALAWRTRLGGPLTAPVAAAGRVYVAARDAHTLYALDWTTGKVTWRFVAGARIDSPPTVFEGLVLFGSADGRVYCLRAGDGTLAWRFLAAPQDCRIACFDQVESVWPVHGSVLLRDGVAYVTAGRSTYLDGGIRLWGLDPATGRVIHQATMASPMPDVKTGRDMAFFLPGANSDVLSAQGDHLFMRQKKLTPELKEVHEPVLSSKGEQDVGLHVFSTAGFLDDSWYNRTFWMYSKRWPGFQLANQAPKSGQLLVVDDQSTYAVKVFYRRNVHTTMFFPGKEGYLLFADRNTTEPQIVGEEGARAPVHWLPQDHIPREGKPGLNSLAFGLDKMIGYTRADPPLWTKWMPIRIRAMVKAGNVLFVAGPPDVLEPDDPYAAFEGRKGARLAAVAADDASILAQRDLDVPPVFDGLIAVGGRLFVALEDGSLACLAGEGAGVRYGSSIRALGE